MACTIDHLAPGLTVRVLRDFTDLCGVAVPAGECGVIQQLGLDWKTMNCFVEWDRAGRREMLWFSGRKTDGAPSNGNMRAFFEIEPEQAVQEPAAPTATAATTAAPVAVEKTPSRPDMPLAQYRGKQPPDNTNIFELRVTCDCDPRLHRPVMTMMHEVNAHACMRCGTATCTKSIGDDGRHTGNSWYACLTVAIPDPAHAWIAQWPPATTAAQRPDRWLRAGDFVRKDHHYLPTNARCETVEELAALNAGIAREHASLTSG